MFLFLEKAVPVVETPDLPPAEFGKSVTLNCTVSYENDNFGAKFDFNVSWWKDGKLVENEKHDYTTGNQILLAEYKMIVKSFKDGGRYECQSSLGDTNRKTLVKNDSVVLSSMFMAHVYFRVVMPNTAQKYTVTLASVSYCTEHLLLSGQSTGVAKARFLLEKL